MNNMLVTDEEICVESFLDIALGFLKLENHFNSFVLKNIDNFLSKSVPWNFKYNSKAIIQRTQEESP